MRCLETGPHRKCENCRALHPEKLCIETRDGKWFCCIKCKVQHERKADETSIVDDVVVELCLSPSPRK